MAGHRRVYYWARCHGVLCARAPGCILFERLTFFGRSIFMLSASWSARVERLAKTGACSRVILMSSSSLLLGTFNAEVSHSACLSLVPDGINSSRISSSRTTYCSLTLTGSSLRTRLGNIPLRPLCIFALSEAWPVYSWPAVSSIISLRKLR
jgi:hypothetical protein